MGHIYWEVYSDATKKMACEKNRKSQSCTSIYIAVCSHEGPQYNVLIYAHKRQILAGTSMGMILLHLLSSAIYDVDKCLGVDLLN